MTQQEFNEIDWKRGNIVMLQNGKEYQVKGTKAHGKYLLLYSWEYASFFTADYRIVASRTSAYEEPEEVYLEIKRQKQEEAKAKREAERQAYLKAKEERKLRNLQEQERIHQEALARKADKLARRQQKREVREMEAEPVVVPEPIPEQPPKKKRKRISTLKVEKISIDWSNISFD